MFFCFFFFFYLLWRLELFVGIVLMNSNQRLDFKQQLIKLLNITTALICHEQVFDMVPIAYLYMMLSSLLLKLIFNEWHFVFYDFLAEQLWEV